MKPIRIVLADEHNLVRAGFRAILAEIASVEIAGESGDGRKAFEMIRAMKPDMLCSISRCRA